MAVTETIELQQGLREALGRELDAVVVNGAAAAPLQRARSSSAIEALASANGAAARSGRRGAAARARRTRCTHARGYQHGQVTRLRRRGFEVLALPFVWTPALDLDDAASSSPTRLGHGLERAERDAAAS